MENITAGEAPVSVEFNVKALAPVAMYMAQKDIRFYLNGICVRPNANGPGCFVAATNGHCMAIWHDPDGVCSKEIVLRVSNELVSASRKKAAKGGRVVLDSGRLVIKNKDGHETFVQAGQAAINMERKGYMHKYPDFWRVVPPQSTLTPGMHGPVNGRYVEMIGKVAKMLEDGGRYGHARAVWHSTANVGAGFGAVLTRFDGTPGFVVITMPMREEDFDPGLPAVFASQLPKEEAAGEVPSC